MPNSTSFELLPWGKDVLSITLFVTILLVMQVALFLVLSFIYRSNHLTLIVFLLSGSLSLMILLLLYAFAPSNYIVTDSNLIICLNSLIGFLSFYLLFY